MGQPAVGRCHQYPRDSPRLHCPAQVRPPHTLPCRAPGAAVMGCPECTRGGSWPCTVTLHTAPTVPSLPSSTALSVVGKNTSEKGKPGGGAWEAAPTLAKLGVSGQVACPFWPPSSLEQADLSLFCRCLPSARAHNPGPPQTIREGQHLGELQYLWDVKKKLADHWLSISSPHRPLSRRSAQWARSLGPGCSARGLQSLRGSSPAGLTSKDTSASFTGV